MFQWQSQDAKAKFSEVVRMAQKEPQMITVRGKEEAVVISREYYNSITQSKLSLVKLMQTSPLVGVEMDLGRDELLPRDLGL